MKTLFELKERGFTPLEIKNHAFYTYVIMSKKDGRWYTGSTNNLRKRFREHNNNKVFSTKGQGPFELIYYEACKNEQDARIREKYLKSGMGKRYLKNRLKRFLSLTGFTLIEIMLVVVIIGILAAMVVPRLAGRTEQAKIAVTTADVKTNIPLALDLYELDIGTYPATLNDLKSNNVNSESWRGPYTKGSPKDAWGKTYYYTCPGTHNNGDYDVYSSGPDGQPGNDDDIHNWE